MKDGFTTSLTLGATYTGSSYGTNWGDAPFLANLGATYIGSGYGIIRGDTPFPLHFTVFLLLHNSYHSLANTTNHCLFCVAFRFFFLPSTFHRIWISSSSTTLLVLYHISAAFSTKLLLHCPYLN